MPTLIRDCSRRTGVTSETGLNLVELTEKGPNGVDPVLRNTLVDGQTGASAAMDSERSDGQHGPVPLRALRCVNWYERFVELPSTSLDRWTVIGAGEIHSNGPASQAPLMPEVGPGTMPNRRRRLNFNAGRSTPRYFDIGPIVLGTWYACQLKFFYTNDGTGWVEFWRNGVKIVERRNEPLTIDSVGGYFKFANYRNANITGRTIYDVSALRVYDGDTGVFVLPSGGGGGVTPDPDTTKPVIELTSPLPDTVLTPGQAIAVNYKVTDDTSLRTIWVGRVASDGNKFIQLDNPTSGTVRSAELAAPPAGDTQVHFYLAAVDTAGNEATPEAFPLLVTSQAPDPPSDLEAAIVARDAALAAKATAEAARDAAIADKAALAMTMRTGLTDLLDDLPPAT